MDATSANLASVFDDWLGVVELVVAVDTDFDAFGDFRPTLMLLLLLVDIDSFDDFIFLLVDEPMAAFVLVFDAFDCSVFLFSLDFLLLLFTRK